nr:formate dehydrogenase alpha subunit, S-FDH alpha {N-terminal} [Alcaligenes eutrophus, Peptide Partial, 15 aa] [Cupriavidus necator]
MNARNEIDFGTPASP